MLSTKSMPLAATSMTSKFFANNHSTVKPIPRLQYLQSRINSTTCTPTATAFVENHVLAVPNPPKVQKHSETIHQRSYKKWTSDFCLIIRLAQAVLHEEGDNCSEAVYQQALLFKLYNNHIPAVMERPLYSIRNGFAVLKGRIDLEIASRFLLELKIHPPSPKNLKQDAKQLNRYLRVYAEQNKNIEQAAVMYFFDNELKVVTVPTHSIINSA